MKTLSNRLIKWVIILVVLGLGLGVIGFCSYTVWRIIKPTAITAQADLPTINESTRDIVRSRQQTVQNITLDQNPTNRRNPFTPYAGAAVTIAAPPAETPPAT